MFAEDICLNDFSYLGKAKKKKNLKFFVLHDIFSQDNVLLSRDNKQLSCTHKLAKSQMLSEPHKFEITTFIFVLPRYKKSLKQISCANKNKSPENKINLGQKKMSRKQITKIKLRCHLDSAVYSSYRSIDC